MTPKLKALLVLLGLAGASLAVSVYTPREGVTGADLVDAGLTSFQPVDATCPARRTLPDGGQDYRTWTTGARWDPTSQSLVLPDLPGTNTEWYRLDLCVRAPSTVAAGAAVAANDECACSTGVGSCLMQNPDGGATPVAAIQGITLNPGTWSGLGCARKPCGGILSRNADGGPYDPTWPSACPQ